MKYIWLDVDPGHDDATAIMLATSCGNLTVLGVSTTHGNASIVHTTQNAARCLWAFGADTQIRVYPGSERPLLAPIKHDPEIHGEDGLGGVEGLPLANDPSVRSYLAIDTEGEPIRALDGMALHIRKARRDGHKVTMISTGPMTNIALFIRVYPDLLPTIEEFVFMGGGIGLGNRSSVAEYNIMCDPVAAQIVLDTPIPKTMIPINVTHTAIVTREIQARLLATNTVFDPLAKVLPLPTTHLRGILSSLLVFFAATYKSVFEFDDGPPLHDALTVAYVSRPELFSVKRYRVDVELSGKHTTGETVADLWNYQKCDDTWGPGGKNCQVAQSLEVAQFFEFFLDCVTRCDQSCPLNIRS